MTRTCDVCGQPYQAKMSRSRYCSGRCRARYTREHRSQLSAPAPLQARRDDDVVEAVTSELAAAGRLDSSLGRSALRLAALMADPLAAGGAVAAVSKELRAVMAEALRDVSVVDDAVDELQRRRDHAIGRSAR